MFNFIQTHLILLFFINFINSELFCNFREFFDTSSIYTCELLPTAGVGHLPGKTDNNVQSFKFDGFNSAELFDIEMPFCENYKNLEIITLISASIADLSDNVFMDCEKLKFLSLASNEIDEIPERLFVGNSKLTTLSLEQNQLTELPENVFSSLKDLSDLNLSKNQIENLPDNIFAALVNLRVLKLSSNKIQSLKPVWFLKLVKLEYLDMSDNLIPSIPDKSFQFLKNLQILKLNQNKIKELTPNAFYGLKNLEELNINFNEISRPSEDAFKPLINLKNLHFGANGIKELPKNIFSHLKKLEDLKLWQNHLSTIHSDSFGIHSGIVQIDLEGNKIDAVDPDLIGRFKELRLYMDGNNCYEGDLEDKSEMQEKLNRCYMLYIEIKEQASLTTTTEQMRVTTTSTTRPTTEVMTTRPATTSMRPRPTRRTTTRTTRTTTEFVEELFIDGPTYFPPPEPTGTPIDLFESTTPKFSWNLLEPQNIPACGRTKIKLDSVFSGAQVGHGAFPWTAALIRSDGKLFCGGVLMSKNQVMTAAHCIIGKKGHYVIKSHQFFVMLGAHNIKQSYEKGRITVTVKAMHIHRDWNLLTDQYDADIAILELNEVVKFNRFIQPICIPEADSIPAQKTHGIVVGYGKSEFADVQDIARLIPVPIHDSQKCHTSHDSYQLLLSHRGICGGYANGTGVCTGDSGSGLIVVHNGTYYLRGIVSASLTGSLNGCNLKAYSVFTDILEFTGWIKIGRDDKTLIQYLIQRIRDCESKKGPVLPANSIEIEKPTGRTVGGPTRRTTGSSTGRTTTRTTGRTTGRTTRRPIGTPAVATNEDPSRIVYPKD
ncbi:uncharacterized protein [Chironomus tepperi]|uniref:uncharacterized protein n=1 Tax=Chironomus tepperi TaxID=113505 RepID=UPI00391F6356